MTKRLIITIPNQMKEGLKIAAKDRGCSQAEVVRSALYENIKRYLKDKEVKECVFQ